jgi:hypothetical protein
MSVQVNICLICKIWGFHGGEYEECRFVGCGAVKFLYEPTFRRNISPEDGATTSHHISENDILQLYLRLQPLGIRLLGSLWLRIIFRNYQWHKQLLQHFEQ